jgi:hypothetical protein
MIAGDTAGAITLLPRGERPEPVSGDVEWLDEGGLAELLTELPSRPMLGGRVVPYFRSRKRHVPT